MTKLRISAVSYTNTFPFIYGLENNSIIEQIELTKDIPSVCAQKLLNNEVDIGLVPAVIIPQLINSEIISDYCIGASGAVRSVILASFKPLEQIKTIYLDHHSRSSVMLTRILANKFWKINVGWLNTTNGFEKNLKQDEAAVIIGDKAMAVENDFPYTYDLAQEWIKYTNLPFVFAAWVSNKNINQKFKSDLNKALKWGVDKIDEMVSKTNFSFLADHINPKEYLTKNIDYVFDSEKQEGLGLFLKYANDLRL